MPSQFVFADETGCFAFNRSGRASRYFILCTVTMADCSIGHDLLELRREMAFHHSAERRYFHCVADPWPARERVFALLGRHEFRADATIFEKSKAKPHTRSTNVRFFNYVWHHHFKFLAPRIWTEGQRLLLTAAALNQHNQKSAFAQAVHDAVQQALPRESWQVAFLNSAEDPCLWVADYCAWALQRKWEHADNRAYRLIADKIKSEFDIWENVLTHFY